MNNYCVSCGMPLKDKKDIGTEIDKGPLCKYCINEDGSVKTCEEVFEGGVQFFINSLPGVDKELAKRITRKNMNNQPCWQGKNNKCLKGEEATDEEFRDARARLHTEIEKGNAKE